MVELCWHLDQIGWDVRSRPYPHIEDFEIDAFLSEMSRRLPLEGPGRMAEPSVGGPRPRGRPLEPLDPEASRAALLGAKLREWRLHRRMSQETLAWSTGFSRQHVSEVERAAGTVSTIFVARCDAVLQAGGELQALLPAMVSERTLLRHRRQAARRRPMHDPARIADSSPSGAARTPGAPDRQEFFGQLSAATVAFLKDHSAGFGDAADRLTWVRRSSGCLDAVAVVHLEELGALLRLSMREARLPTRVQLAELLAHLRHLVALDPGRQSGDLRHRLLRLVGEQAAMAGYLAMLGLWDLAAGKACFGFAQTAAREAGHPELEALILGHRSYAAVFSERPAEALELAQAGHGLTVRGPSGPLTRAYLAAAEAVMHAAAGQEAGCWRSLDLARVALVEVPRRAPQWIGFGTFDTTSLAAYEGAILLSLDRARRAREVLHHALRTAGPAHSYRAHVLSNLAAACVCLGDIDEGCRLGEEALMTGLWTEDGYAVGRVQKLYGQIVQRNRHHSGVRRLGDRLRPPG